MADKDPAGGDIEFSDGELAEMGVELAGRAESHARAPPLALDAACSRRRSAAPAGCRRCVAADDEGDDDDRAVAGGDRLGGD